MGDEDKKEGEDTDVLDPEEGNEGSTEDTSDAEENVLGPEVEIESTVEELVISRLAGAVKFLASKLEAADRIEFFKAFPELED